MPVTVYHAKNMLRGEAVFPQDFTLVATVQTESRDEAFLLTNDADGCRSTSVGDLCVVGGIAHLVLALGWQNLGPLHDGLRVPPGYGFLS